MVQRYLIFAAVAALVPNALMAGLQVGMNSSMLGMLCYSEEDESSGVRLIACGPNGLYDQDMQDDILYKCPNSYSDYTYESNLPKHTPTCYLGSMGGYLYICDTIEVENSDLVCNYCGFSGVSWESIGGNRVRGISNDNIDSYSTAKNWRCTISKPYDYGCAAGYYKSGGSGSSITCVACPESVGHTGHSAIGNTAITGCYIPTGNDFSDNDGSGTVTGDCFYKN